MKYVRGPSLSVVCQQRHHQPRVYGSYDMGIHKTCNRSRSQHATRHDCKKGTSDININISISISITRSISKVKQSSNEWIRNEYLKKKKKKVRRGIKIISNESSLISSQERKEKPISSNQIRYRHGYCALATLFDAPRLGTGTWWYARRCSSKWSFRGKPLWPFLEQSAMGQSWNMG